MNSDEFRKFGKAAVDYVSDYLENIREKQVLPSIQPGYLQRLLPQMPPTKGEPWQCILQDVDSTITPGLTHWHSPNFHAFYPTANSYPGIVGELLLSGLGTISTDQLSDDVSTELELKMLDWLAKMLTLPRHFLNNSPGPGGGLIQNAASESTLIALLTAKNKSTQTSQLVAYTSEQSNSSVEKAGLLASVTMRLLPTDQEGKLRAHTLRQAIENDISAGLTPCCVVATLGTTGTCAFDPLDEIGPVCQKFSLWLHVDAAYAGSAFVCPEYRHLMEGVEFADSFCINPHKWLLVNSDCSAMWFKDTSHVEKLLGKKSDDPPNIQFWQLPDVRRFRSLKMWFVFRSYGVEGLQKHIRDQINLAKNFEDLVQKDDRFEVCTANMGLVCFRLKGEDSPTRILLDRITKRKNIFVMPYYYQNKFVIRFVICSRFTQIDDVFYAWQEICSQIPTTLKCKSVTETVKKNQQVSIS